MIRIALLIALLPLLAQCPLLVGTAVDALGGKGGNVAEFHPEQAKP